jgi:hypothetical protein
MWDFLADLLKWAQAILDQWKLMVGSVVVVGITALADQFLNRPTVPKTWVIIGTVLLASFRAWRAERKEVVRLDRDGTPEFSLKNARIEPIAHPATEKPVYYQFLLPMIQIREHAAMNLDGHLLILDTHLQSADSTILNQPIVSVNEIPKGGPLRVASEQITIQKATRPVFVVLVINYEDAITQSKKSQVFYYLWRGAKDGVYEKLFYSPSVEDKKHIIEYMRTTLRIEVPG